MSETVIDNLVIEISTDSSAASSNIDKVSKSLKGLNQHAGKTDKTAKALKSLARSIRGISVSGALRGIVKDVNSYVENVNLFTISMGKYADEAMSYAKKVQSAMGVDISEFIRNQAIFKNMADGFGMAEDKAYTLSKGLTELAYDMSSFYNVGMEEVFQRLQSGVAGEIEPVRRWGIALDQASMKQWMLQKGIKANIATMNQADKALVRYNMIVETMSSKGAIGDLARTIQTPANAIRILKQQITQLSRAIGSLLIPVMVKVIPYVQAFVKVVTQAAQAIAKLFGVDLDFNVDYSGVTTGIVGVGDAMDDAAKSAKKLKDYTMGFDELNIISPDTGSAAAQQAGLSGLDLEALSVWDDSIFESINSDVDRLAEKMRGLVALVAAVGAGLALWKISTILSGGLNFVRSKLAEIAASILGMSTPKAGLAKVIGFLTGHAKGIAITAVAVTAVFLALRDLWKHSETFRSAVTNALTNVKNAFINLKDTVWNDVVNPILEAFGITAGSFSDLYATCIRPIVEWIATLFVNVLGASIVAVIDTASAFATIFGEVIGFVANGISTFVSGTVSAVTGLVEKMKAQWKSIRENTENVWQAIGKAIITVMESLPEPIKNVINGMISMFEFWANRIIGAVNAIIGALNSIKVTIPEWVPGLGGKSWGISIPYVPTISLPRFEDGGFIEDGLFTMNHGEIAGKFSNGKSVVANNQQIVDGIAEGVYRAMMQVQNEESEKPMQVNVYLDGKQVSKSVNKYNDSRGKVIMGNSLGYNF